MWWILALVGKGPFRFRIYAGTMTAIFLLTIPGGIVSSNLFLGFLYAGLALIPPAVEWFIRDSASRTRCPDCREEIRADANVCKHCGFRLRPRPKLGAYRAHR
jgi:hypothetical protein